MRKLMMIGKIGCGKTTLSQRLLGQEVSYKKTQALELVGQDILDTPGEYLEQRQFYKALVVTAVEADVILLLASAIDQQTAFSPRMSTMFSEKPVIGVITKVDLCDDPEQICAAELILEMAGADVILQVGFGDETCIQELREVIENIEK